MVNQDLLRYWPREEDVAACVKTDAEASSEAVSLAVHQPMRFERRVIGGEGGVIGQCNEHELLQSFLTNNLPDGRVILPIVGSSGTGKSHVIRWLDAQIRRQPGAERRVVIRIPKGTSLKGVLGILLKELHGKKYDRYKQELVRAQQELDPKEAAGLLCEMLAYTLEEMADEARAKIRTNPADRSAQEREAFCRSDFLPSLLRNQYLRDQHFVRKSDGGDGVVKRLVEQLTEGRDAGTDDDRKHLFTTDDLEFDDRIERECLGRSEFRALNQFDREDRRGAAVRILNDALDDAKQRLLHLDPTVADLFDEVRRELLSEGKELVLLVEDYAVLSGLQKQLLQVIIKEAIRDGQPVLCTMRTALAYTTGYMDTATVLTRANVEYRIPDEPGTEAEIQERIALLVGAYLNAARFGQSELEKAYRETGVRSEDLRKWIPKFEVDVEPEVQSTLDAFGVSSDGYEFFPFNKNAINELAREGCLHAGRLVYNPRYVIQNVINKVLINRNDFVHDSFPPAIFGENSKPLPAMVVEEVRRRVQTTEFERYLRFLHYWGGFPSEPTDILQVDRRVFTAFGFDRARFGPDTRPVGPNPKIVEKIIKDEPPTVTSPQSNPTEKKWNDILERWRDGVQIPQSDANQLRKWVSEALRGYVEWDWDLFRPRKDRALDSWFAWIYIPSASGNEGRSAKDSMVALCTDNDLSDVGRSARVHATLMSVIRFHGIHKGSWDYEGADQDLSLYAAFLDNLAPQARDFVRRRYFKADWDSLPVLVQGLLIGARALGLDNGAKDGDAPALINAIFAANPDGATEAISALTTEVDTTGWSEFTDTLRRCRRTGKQENRDISWTGHILNIVGARQGQADTVHAIDVLRLKPIIEEILKGWEFKGTLPNPSGVPDFAPVRSAYSEMKRLSSSIAHAQRRLYNWRKKMVVWLGENAEKESLVCAINESIEKAKAAGLTGCIEANDLGRLKKIIEEFRNAKVKAALEDTAKLAENAPRGTILAVLSRGYEPVVRISEDFKTRWEEFSSSIEEEIHSQSLRYGPDPLSEGMETLKIELDKTERLMKELKRNDAAG